MRRGKLLVACGATTMVLSTVIGIALFVYGFGPMISGFLALTSASAETTQMPGTLTVPGGHPGGLLTTIQSPGALPATCSVRNESGEPIGLQETSTVGNQGSTADGRALRVIGLFDKPSSETYTVECSGSGEFAVIEYAVGRAMWGLVSFGGFIGFAIGLGLLIVGIVVRRRNGADSAGTNFGPPSEWHQPPSPWPADANLGTGEDVTTGAGPVRPAPPTSNDSGGEIPGRYPR